MKMKNFGLFLSMVMLVLFMATSCGETEEEDLIKGESASRFLTATDGFPEATIDSNGPILDGVYDITEITDLHIDSNGIYYLRDPITDTMFLYMNGFREGGLTAMFDPETGDALTYKRFMKFYETYMESVVTENEE